MKHTKYDVVIIGSGMGGLSSGLILAKNGLKVCVLEKNQQFGGNLQMFSRDKRIFDTGVHYIGGLDEGENLHSFFKYFGLMDNVEFERLDADCFEKIIIKGGKTINYGLGYENFKKQLLNSFPEEENAIDQYCKLMQDTCKCFPLYNLELDSEKSYLKNTEILEQNAYEVVANITDNKELMNAFFGTSALYAGVKEKTPFYMHALIINSYIKGAYRVKNGSAEISKFMIKEIRKLGGDAFKREEITSVSYTEDGLIEYVNSKSGKKFYADKFISNVHPALTLKITGDQYFRKAYRNRINSLENTISSFLVHLSLKDNVIKYKKYNEYYLRIDDIWNTIPIKKETWPEILFISSPSNKKGSEYADSISIMAYMDFENFEKWKSSHNTIVNQNERPAGYEEYKTELENKVIDALSEIYPDIRSQIIAQYSSTPLTIRDYINSPEGSVYGFIKDCNKPAKSIINPRTKIKNLFLTGQNIVFHGILGVVVGAFATSFELIDKHKLLEDVRNT